MKNNTIDSNMWIHMVHSGANHLCNERESINKLNVFPVHDGDTGTNMNLSMTSGVEEMGKVTDASLRQHVQTFSRGLLMGARGNSGVILSQLFRGFAEEITDQATITITQFAQAMNKGVETAYQSVTNPVEGTILTVAKDMANTAIEIAPNSDDFVSFLQMIVQAGHTSLANTPELLPILK